MAVNWIDTSKLPFNSLLLLESIQIGWFPGWLPEKELAIALGANPTVEWFLRNKCTEIRNWLDKIVSLDTGKCNKNDIHKAEQTILNSINDLLTYVIDPSIYDAQPFLQWDLSELTSIASFNGKIIIDVGAGTGKITFIAALKAQAVYAVEPVANLRFYLKQKAKKKGIGYVFGDNKEEEYKEMERVTKKGGIVIYYPGNDDLDNERHQFLVNKGYKWSKFETPGKGMKRKYWKRLLPSAVSLTKKAISKRNKRNKRRFS